MVISCKLNGKNFKSEEFALPLLVTEFIEAKEVNIESSLSSWETLENKNANIDAILPNPAPTHFSHMQVLMKLAQILNEFLGFYVVPPQNQDNFTSLIALGMVNMKNPGLQTFPNSATELKSGLSIPVMIQVAMYPDISMEQFRFSIRSNDKESSASILSIFKIFVSKS